MVFLSISNRPQGSVVLVTLLYSEVNVRRGLLTLVGDDEPIVRVSLFKTHC
jgi:hypothetical protein